MERELLLLGLLRREDMHGYQLTEFISNNMSACIDLKKSTAYYILDRIAQQGWVTKTEEQAGNRPTRFVYTLTPDGEAAFHRLLRENLEQFQLAEFPGDIGLGFLDELPPGEARHALDARRADLIRQLEEARAIPSHPGSMQFTIEHRIHHLESELAWLDDIIARLLNTATTTT